MIALLCKKISKFYHILGSLMDLSDNLTEIASEFNYETKKNTRNYVVIDNGWIDCCPHIQFFRARRK